MLQRFPVIVGPTAGGKSALALSLARRLRQASIAECEIVTADSMQVYRGMDIGTAKPGRAERADVVHHLVDIVEPTDSFSVNRWLDLATPLIDAIRGLGRLPIVVGGSHLYIKALIEGMFEGPVGDAALRLELDLIPAGDLRAELERIDAASASRLHPNDRRRTIRAIEVFRLTGIPISAWQTQWDAGRARPDVLLVGLDWSPESTNRRINARVREMITSGLVDEAHGLWTSLRLGDQAREALGYKQLIEHFEGRVSLDEAIERIKIETRRFAKNQRTWLRRLRTIPGSKWIAMDGAEEEAMLDSMVASLREPYAAPPDKIQSDAH